MKIFRILGMIGITLLMAGQTLLYAQSGKNGDEKEYNIHEIVEKRDFCIDVDKAIPMSGPLVNLTSPYSVKINGDSVVSSLPFFGRAHSVPYGGGNGLNFEGQVKDYSFSEHKKGSLNIAFETKSDDDYVKFRILLYPNGNALITVQSTHRQSISFQGNLRKVTD